MSIQNNLRTVLSTLPKHVTLVAVSKTNPVSAIQEAYNAGQRIFGENKIQEMVEKYEALPKDIEWHMIGHLQSNKVKYMASFVHLIHGVDSFKKLEEINKQALKHNRIINCLLQIKIASEDTKFGLSLNELDDLVHSNQLNELKNIHIQGFMGMASFTDDEQQIKIEFDFLKQQFDKLKTVLPDISILSMGMSGDYELAIECGSNMVRIGSSIFGSR